MIIFFTLLTLVTVTSVHASRVPTITRFSTDGCSSFPDGIPGLSPNLWQNCCFEHDIAYWMGGTEQQKHNADVKLGVCVNFRTFSRELGAAMTLGVLIGGRAEFDSSFRWSYGWPYGRGYKPLTESEKLQAVNTIAGENLPREKVRIIINYLKAHGLMKYLRHPPK